MKISDLIGPDATREARAERDGLVTLKIRDHSVDCHVDQTLSAIKIDLKNCLWALACKIQTVNSILNSIEEWKKQQRVLLEPYLLKRRLRQSLPVSQISSKARRI